MDMFEYRKALKASIERKDYTKIDCPSRNHSWYFNQRRIPDGEIYECECPQCGMSLKRKKV